MSDGRRSFLAALAATIAGLSFFRRREARPSFPERTPPGNRFRKFALGNRDLYLREDLFRSGWLGELRHHDQPKEDRR